jgi:uncharacterized protein (DUF1330 family)
VSRIVEKWKLVFDEHRAAREQHGALGHTLLLSADDPSTPMVINEFPSREAAEAFANDPSLPEAMSRAGVSGPPRIEFYELSERVAY